MSELKQINEVVVDVSYWIHSPQCTKQEISVFTATLVVSGIADVGEIVTIDGRKAIVVAILYNTVICDW